MPYTNTHRALAQAFMGRKCVTADEGRKILAAVLQVEHGEEEVPASEVTEGALMGYIGEVNDELSNFDFEIRSMRSQKDRSTVFALVNNTSDDIIQSATPFTPDEIGFFRRVLDAMFITNNTLRAEVLAVRLQDAVHLNKVPPGASQPADGVAPVAGITLHAAETALTTFVEHGWLVKSRANYYSLGERALLELSGYLTQTYNYAAGSEDDEDTADSHGDAVKFCYACKELLTVGERCDKLKCVVRLHEPCAKQFFRTAREREQRCPACKKDWTGNEKVGEAAAPKLLARRKSGGAVPTPRRAGREPSVATDADGDEALPDADAEGESEEEVVEEEDGEE
ncbi:DNA repair protein Nse1 [Geopyxis carbonaria]|nr:DNA repair protein Nse1 [Geopyxis carbonaria]